MTRHVTRIPERGALGVVVRRTPLRAVRPSRKADLRHPCAAQRKPPGVHRRAVLGERQCAAWPQTMPGEFVAIAVRDDGAGMEYQELVSRTNQWSQADRVG